MAQLSANEQYLLELINAARTEIGAQPLASNTLLDQAAEDHSEWMINTDIFSHSGAGGSDPGTRMTAAGYTFGGSSWTWGENIAWASTRAPDGYQDEVRLLHTNLMNSPGHRENLLNGDFKEVGLGFEIGEYQGWQGAFVTEDFARSGTGSLLTGVAYNDTNGNHFYDPGEGLGGITVDAVDSTGTHFTTTTMDAGGYNLNLTLGTYSVTFRAESGATPAQSVTIGASNVKVDAVDPTFATVLEANGATRLDQVGTHFYFDDPSTGSGPSLEYTGTDVIAGQFGGGWTPISAEKTASGYEVAWKAADQDLYTVWDTDANGNYTGNAIDWVSGSDPSLQRLETSFAHDLNGDGHIGLLLV